MSFFTETTLARLDADPRNSPGVGAQPDLERDALHARWLTAQLPHTPSEGYNEVEYRRHVSRCESPIEARLLPWLLASNFPFFRLNRPPILLPGQQDRLREDCVAIVPQLPIGRFRVDFALAMRRSDGVKFIVVECDGRDFHDAEADKVRDAEIFKKPRVLQIVRIPGAVIVADAREAQEMIYRAFYWAAP